MSEQRREGLHPQGVAILRERLVNLRAENAQLRERLEAMEDLAETRLNMFNAEFIARRAAQDAADTTEERLEAQRQQIEGLREAIHRLIKKFWLRGVADGAVVELVTVSTVSEDNIRLGDLRTLAADTGEEG